MTIRVRIAPSPTGYIHIGNVRAGLVNWLFAKRHGGSFMLRIDDTDKARSKPEYEQAIYDDLRWLGLTWDRTAKQSDRMGVYADLAEKLKAVGTIYPCFETEEELELKRKSQLARGLPPVYDRAALTLSEADVVAKLAAGAQPHYRFKLNHAKPIKWHDLIEGDKEFDPKTMSDPVVIKEDGTMLFMFCGMVDDLLDDTTHVIRGADHVSNNAVQLQIAAAVAPLMGKEATLAAMQFGHYPRLMTLSGEKMSKRLGTMSVREMRDELGLEAAAITSYISRLGTSLPLEAVESLDALAADFDLAHISRNQPKIDLEEIKRINAKVLHGMPFSAVQARLESLGLHGVDEKFWHAVRGVLHTLPEAAEWWQVVNGDITPPATDVAVVQSALANLPAAPWDESTFSALADAVKAATGKKGKELFMPLRLALTGKDHGPEMRDLLPLIGHARATARLAKAAQGAAA